jgi:UDP-glucose 4-epimerase
MKILVTGSQGFIGRNLIKVLSSEHEIFAVSRRSVESVTRDRCLQVCVDLSHPDFSQKLPLEVDCVVHLAQSNQYRDFPSGAEDMRRVNIDSTAQLLEWSRTTGVKQFIFASTANIYGSSDGLLEEDDQKNPKSFYGATKLAAENLVTMYSDFFQTDVLRFFTVYGPGQKGMLVANLIERIKGGQKITISGDNELLLTPIFINDVVEVICKLLQSKLANGVRILNICGDSIVTLRSLVQHLESLLCLKAKIERTKGKVENFTGSNALMKKLLEDFRLLNLEEGLELTVGSNL